MTANVGTMSGILVEHIESKRQFGTPRRIGRVILTRWHIIIIIVIIIIVVVVIIIMINFI